MGDIPKLVEFENRVFMSYYRAHRFDQGHFRYYLADTRTIATVAVKRDSIVGYVLGVVHTGRWRHLARIHSIGVDPTCREEGIGTRLTHAFLRVAKKRRCKRAILEIALTNKSGLRFFRNVGFVKKEVLRNYYAQGVDGLRMELAL
jgi:ribosomal protein S18 acetylase RimI-like enzyme